jgi:hypothetical protein
MTIRSDHTIVPATDKVASGTFFRRGDRGLYFDDPNGHVLEVMTVPETGS